jgi:integrase/recombinase XerD
VRGVFILPKINDLEYVLDDYLLNCNLRNLSSKTIKSYDQSLKLFAKYLEENFKITNIKQLKKNHVEEYISFSKDKGKYSFVADISKIVINNPHHRRDYEEKISASTVNNYLRNIKAFLNWCVKERIVRENVASEIKHLKVTRKRKEQITDLEYKLLLKTLDTTKYVEFRDHVIINLMFDSGMRLGETLALTVGDVDLMRKTAIINADNSKSKKDRVVFYSSKMSQLLRRWIQYKDRYLESEYLFPTNRAGKLQVTNFEKNFKKYLKMTGIKKDITPHSLRNNFGRRCLMAGMDIFTLSRVLGHSSVEVTEKAYLDLSDEDLRKNYQRFSPLENMDY